MSTRVGFPSSALDGAVCVSHVRYRAERYRNSPDCANGIRSELDQGWRVTAIRGPRHGPFVVIYRKDEEAA